MNFDKLIPSLILSATEDSAMTMALRMTPQARAHEDPDRFVAAMAGAATQVSVVTTDGAAGRFGVTVSAFSSVSAEPPLVLVCINRRSPAIAAITANNAFCVNLLGDDQSDIANCFAGRPGAIAPYDFTCANCRPPPPAHRCWAAPSPISTARSKRPMTPAPTASSLAACIRRSAPMPPLWPFPGAPIRRCAPFNRFDLTGTPP